ncbi:armadillo-type protein [Blyttiomyces helicus]|uniref:Armadillo-type protein n=1 Tax=Blyttiomyces helicus TaxID=388810 RepID=A0A4P9WG18_9FUNG|nr:armadillo-type protein [Blyttiomyces helicus]|eukprot:RKO89386.1 armadillo-type protein [Blyttiomyces helicus]
MAQQSPYQLASVLEKMSSADSDFRYMATADLTNLLQTDACQLDDTNERKIVHAVIHLLEDNNSEVQNMAVKCLAPLVRKVNEPQLQEIVEKLCKCLSEKQESLRDVASVGLKTVIVEIPSHSQVAGNIIKRLIPKLIQQLSQNSQDVQMDALDILSEVLSRFGQLLVSESSGGAQLQKSIQKTLFPLLDHTRPAVRKRTTVAIGNLVTHSSDDLFNSLVAQLLAELQAKKNAGQNEKLRTLVSCVSTLSRYSPLRLGAHLDQLLPLILDLTKLHDDELIENCLHSLESFVLRCPTEISSKISVIIGVALQFIKYDPNYNDEDEADDEDDEMETDETGEDEAEDEDEDDEDNADYSDDEDMSWKVRRASSKLIASVISTRPELLEELFKTVSPVLISRLKEREESVRVDIFNTYIALVRQTGASAGSGKSISASSFREPASKRRKGSTGSIRTPLLLDPRDYLREQVPRLAKALSKQLGGKSIQTRQTGFTLLRELVGVLNAGLVNSGGLENHIGLFVPAIESSLSNTHMGHPTKALTNSNLKIETLEFVRILFTTHEPTVFHKYLGRLVPPILEAANDKFYKITSEALHVSGELVQVIRPFQLDSNKNPTIVVPLASPEFQKYIEKIYQTILERLQTTDIDLEVKERSITALAMLLSQSGDLLPPAQIEQVVLPLLVERLKNELTRLTTVRMLTLVAESPLLDTPSGKAISLVPILPTVLTEVSACLRKSHRHLRVAALQCLETLVRRYGTFLPTGSCADIVGELKPIMSDSDLHILPLAMTTLCAVVTASAAIGLQVLRVVRSDIVPQISRILSETPHLVAAGTGLDALLGVWQTLVQVGGSQVFDECIKLLVDPVEKPGKVLVSKQSYSTMAKSIATLCLTLEASAPPTIAKFVSRVESDKTSENLKYLSLLTLGEIGRKIDLSTAHPKLHQILLNLFSSPSEEIRQAAAFALGNITLGNLKTYMPVVLAAIREGGKKRYLVLVALREIITRFSLHDASSAASESLTNFAPELWALLFQNVSEGQEEGTRNVISECLGKLSLSEPARFLPDLQGRLGSKVPAERATVVTAIRYTFTEHAESEGYDALLAPLIGDFLRLVQDPDPDVRRVSLATLNSAAHNKPHLISSSLNEILPLLYGETIVKVELIKTVEMGPFKHKVDDGFEARKSAYECMYTLLETCLSRIEIFGFLHRVLHGLSDPSMEIKQLTHLMLQHLAQLTPTPVAQKLPDTIDPLRKSLLTQPQTKNAVKQELEQIEELVRSAARTVIVLARLAESAAVDGGRFEEFVKEMRGAESPVAGVLAGVAAEVEAGGAQVGGAGPGIVPMDLS